jgi:hypothetical protein
MSDEFDWNFVDEDDAKAEIRAAVEYLLRGATGGARGDIVLDRSRIRSSGLGTIHRFRYPRGTGSAAVPSH